MHTREMLELAALVAQHGPVLARGVAGIPSGSIEAYWSASRCRLNRWHRRLKAESGKRKAASGETPLSAFRAPPSPLPAVIEEILASEVLTRVWTAVMDAYDRHRGADLTGPVARSVFAAHVEARHRVLTLLVSGSAVTAEEAMRLDLLRRRAERWTDVLLGQLAALGDVAPLAFDPERAADFAEDFKPESPEERGRLVGPLLMSSMRAAFRRGLAPVSPNADLNAKIASSIVAFFPPELLDGTGVPESLWLLRILQTTLVAEGMIDELLSAERRGGVV
jgi:hypothetical protein